jgi:hypothetical protein
MYVVQIEAELLGRAQNSVPNFAVYAIIRHNDTDAARPDSGLTRDGSQCFDDFRSKITADAQIYVRFYIRFVRSAGHSTHFPCTNTAPSDRLYR